jgi:hypothetical protein
VDVDVSRKRCSFCGEPGEWGRRDLAGGLGAFICGECAAYHHSVLSSREVIEGQRREGTPPWTRMSNTELLAVIPMISRNAAQVDEFLVEWVELTRSRGISWAEIGKVMGVSRQAAWERFSQRVERLRESRAATGTES